MKKMRLNHARVMFVYHEFTYGGASKSLSFWLNVLNASGAEVSVVTYKSIKAAYYEIPRDIKIIGPLFSRRIPVLSRISDLLTVVIASLKLRPHVVIGMMPVNSFYGFIASRLSGAKVIVSERGCPAKETGLFGFVKHWAMNRGDGAIFQTKGAMSFYSSRLQKKSVLIPNAAISTALPIKFEDRISEFLFVGRFEVESKRHDILLRALKILVQKKPGVKVNFYGDGPDHNKIKELVKNMGLSNNVCFNGVSFDILNLMERYKYFVMTSDHEGIPNALIEAMLSGMACISTDCEPGGARELIVDGSNGILVNKGDVKGVADAMERLMDHPQLACFLGTQARSIKSKLNPQVISEQIVNYVGGYVANR